MDIRDTSPKSCDPQLIVDPPQDPSVPRDDWGLDQLADYSRAENTAITKGEKSLTARYWRLGLALDLARHHFSRGQWAKYLEDLGVDKTRASKAQAIRGAFSEEQAVYGLSVQEAYARRERKHSNKKGVSRSGMRSRPDIAHWLAEVCKTANVFSNASDVAKPGEVDSLLAAIETAIEELTKLKRQVAAGKTGSEGTLF